MREINLLPRKSFLAKYIVPLHAALLAVGLLIVLLQFTVASNYVDSGRSAERQKEEADKRIAQLGQKSVPNERTLAYNIAKAHLDKLKLARPDWLKDLAYIVGYLPTGTDLVSMSVSGEALFLAELHFEDVPQLISYLQRLYAEPRFSTLRVLEFSKAEACGCADAAVTAGDSALASEIERMLAEPEKSAPTSVAPQTSAPTSDPILPQTPQTPETVDEADILLKSLLNADPEEISAELKRLLEKDRQAKDKQVIQGDIWLGEDSPFTLEELLERLAKSSNTPSTSAPAPSAEPETPPEESPIVFPIEASIETAPSDAPETGKAAATKEYYILRIDLTLQSAGKESR